MPRASTYHLPLTTCPMLHAPCPIEEQQITRIAFRKTVVETRQRPKSCSCARGQSQKRRSACTQAVLHSNNDSPRSRSSHSYPHLSAVRCAAIHSYLYLLNLPMMMMLPGDALMTCNSRSTARVFFFHILLLLLFPFSSAFCVCVCVWVWKAKSHILWDARCSVNGVSTA